MRLTINLPAHRVAGASAAVTLGLLLGVGAAAAQANDQVQSTGATGALNAPGPSGQEPQPPTDPAQPPTDPAQPPMPAEPGEEGQAPQAPQLTVDGEVGIIFYNVLANHANDFEALFKKVQEAMLQSENPTRKQQASGMRLMKSSAPAPGEAVAYMLIIDPVMKDTEYDPGMLVFETFPSEASELFKDLNSWLDPNQPSALIPLNTVMEFGR